jgi:hypothetical protein
VGIKSGQQGGQAMNERTGYSPEDRKHTEDAHIAAQRIIYPEFFQVPFDSISYQAGIEYIESDGSPGVVDIKWFDSWMSIDRILRVPAPVEKSWLEFTIQERFERASAASYRNISITHLNTATGNVSELYKIKAHYFVSGYFDGKNFVGKAHICSVERILKKTQSGELRFFKKPNHKNQDFITYGYDDLERCGAMLMQIDFNKEPPAVYIPEQATLQRIDGLEANLCELNHHVKTTNSLLLQLLNQTKSVKPLRHGNVIPINGKLFGESA